MEPLLESTQLIKDGCRLCLNINKGVLIKEKIWVKAIKDDMIIGIIDWRPSGIEDWLKTKFGRIQWRPSIEDWGPCIIGWR